MQKQTEVNMRTRQEYVDIIKSHADELRSRFGITSLLLFGSVARNEHHEGSDVDLFVTMPPKPMKIDGNLMGGGVCGTEKSP